MRPRSQVAKWTEREEFAALSLPRNRERLDVVCQETFKPISPIKNNKTGRYILRNLLIVTGYTSFCKKQTISARFLVSYNYQILSTLRVSYEFLRVPLQSYVHDLFPPEHLKTRFFEAFPMFRRYSNNFQVI